MVSRPTVQVLLLVVFFCANFLLFCFYRENSGGPHKVTVSQDWTDGGRNFSWEETHLVIDSNVSFAVVGKDEDEERDENEEAQNAPGASSPASASLEQLMAERQLRMRMGCDLMSSRSPSSITHNYQNVLLIRDDEGNDRENSLLWCPVFKASSSTWLHYLLDTTSTLTQERTKRFQANTRTLYLVNLCSPSHPVQKRASLPWQHRNFTVSLVLTQLDKTLLNDLFALFAISFKHSKFSSTFCTTSLKPLTHVCDIRPPRST